MSYIEEKPSFEELYEMRRLADEVIQDIQSLSDCGDTVQRATELVIRAGELLRCVKQICVEK